MCLQDLLPVVDLPRSMVAQIEELVALKAVAQEAAPTSRSRELEKLIIGELENAHLVPERPNAPAFEREADALFLDLISA